MFSVSWNSDLPGAYLRFQFEFRFDWLLFYSFSINHCSIIGLTCNRLGNNLRSIIYHWYDPTIIHAGRTDYSNGSQHVMFVSITGCDQEHSCNPESSFSRPIKILVPWFSAHGLIRISSRTLLFKCTDENSSTLLHGVFGSLTGSFALQWRVQQADPTRRLSQPDCLGQEFVISILVFNHAVQDLFANFQQWMILEFFI